MRSYSFTASEEDDERSNECADNQKADARLRQFHAECHLDDIGDGETMTGGTGRVSKVLKGKVGLRRDGTSLYYKKPAFYSLFE